MLVLSIAIVPLLIAPVVFRLSGSAEETIVAVDWLIWGAFSVEYLIRLYLAPAKWGFVRSNKIDLLVIALPFLRPLRVVRSARTVQLLRTARAAAFFGRALDAGKEVLTRHKLNYALLVTALVVFAAAGLVFAFEQGAPGANIGTYSEALWWAITTITTVGYGDKVPTTAAGRGVGVVLMLVGIGVFGLLAGSLASFFVERHEQKDLDPRLDEMSERLKRIEEILQEPRQSRTVVALPEQTAQSSTRCSSRDPATDSLADPAFLDGVEVTHQLGDEIQPPRVERAIFYLCPWLWWRRFDRRHFLVALWHRYSPSTIP